MGHDKWRDCATGAEWGLDIRIIVYVNMENMGVLPPASFSRARLARPIHAPLAPLVSGPVCRVVKCHRFDGG